jgi:hypothetical protein
MQIPPSSSHLGGNGCSVAGIMMAGKVKSVTKELFMLGYPQEVDH